MKDLLPNKPKFRVDEVAGIFGVTPKTVYRWIEEQRFEVKRTPGGGIRIPREALKKFMESDSQP